MGEIFIHRRRSILEVPRISSFPGIASDRLALRPDHLIGPVVTLQRGSREHTVWEGPIGRLLGTVLRLVRMIEEAAVSPLHPLYEHLSRSGILRRCMSNRLKMRVISFERVAGKELHLLLGRRVIGRRLPGTIHWHIRRPFRLLVDEESLPEDPQKYDPIAQSPKHRGPGS